MSALLRFCEGLKLAIDLLMQPIALLGNRSSGKTYGGLKLFELAHEAGVQCIWIDPVGKAFGLRLGVDGKPEGGLKNVYIFGGKRGDFPLTPDKGKFIARFLVEKRVSVVLDVSLMRKSARKQFLTDLLEEFYYLKKEAEDGHPTVFFLEEAHLIAPQKPQKGDERMLGAVEDIVLLGRNAGIGCVIMDQRPAHVNKSCLAEVELLLALRTTYPIDRKVYREWIAAKGAQEIDFDSELPELGKGEGFLWCPSEKIFAKTRVLERVTFDSSATVRIGANVKKVGALSKVDVDAVADAMKEVTAEVAASDPRALRARVAELKKQLALAQRAPANAPVTSLAIDKTAIVRLEKLAQNGQAQANKAQAIGQQLYVKLDEIAKLGAAWHEGAVALAQAREDVRAPNTPRAQLDEKNRLFGDRYAAKPAVVFDAIRKTADAAREIVSQPENGEGEPREPLNAYALGLLKTLTDRYPMKLTRKQLAVLSGKSLRSSAFALAVSALKKHGIVVYDGTHGVLLTEKALSERGVVTPPNTPQELRDRWLRTLPMYEGRLFKAALGTGVGNSFTRESLAGWAEVSLTSSAFSMGISTLKKNGIFESDGDGVLRVSETFR